ncbi:MAG: hypothetical protein ACO1TE_25830 [Prosthecobacter sp.]
MAKRKRKPAPDSALSAGPDPEFLRAKQMMLGGMDKVLQEKGLHSPEEQRAFLEQLLGIPVKGGAGQLLRESGLESAEMKADRLFFDSIKGRSATAIRRRLAEVLKLDPEHVRALTAMAMMEPSPQRAEEELRKVIALGEKKLGNLMTEGRGRLWKHVEARPCLEARARLAELLSWMEGRLDDSIVEHQEILRLNEDDNQGIRDPLLGLLLEARRFAEARGLLRRYESHDSAVWLYGEALLDFHKHAEATKWAGQEHTGAWLEEQMQTLTAGGAPEIPASVRQADKTLMKALEHNPWGAIYLLHAEDFMDDPMPSSHTPGSEEEARLLLEHQYAAWMESPPALLWLTLTAMPWLLDHGFEEELAP